MKLECEAVSQGSMKKFRVFMDGCFDIMHFGHANAMRQAKALGDVLVVGVVAEAEIRANKGPPILSTQERLAVVKAVKWVDEVIVDTPYCITEDFMHFLFTEKDIDFIIHGDDPCLLPDGSDAYINARKAGKYKQIKRTEGVSTTEIIGRMLMCGSCSTCGPCLPPDAEEPIDNNIATIGSPLLAGRGEIRSVNPAGNDNNGHAKPDNADWNGVNFTNGSGDGCSSRRSIIEPSRHSSSFLLTSHRIVQFAHGCATPGPETRVVYVDGDFDIFHAGHVKVLERARQMGHFLLVGIHTDEVVRQRKGCHWPIMSLNERCLSVLACKCVDDIILGAPRTITRDLITTCNVSIVIHVPPMDSSFLLGRDGKEKNCSDTDYNPHGQQHEGAPASDPYAVPKEMGIYKELDKDINIFYGRVLTSDEIVKRIIADHESYEARHANKSLREASYYSSKVFVQEL